MGVLTMYKHCCKPLNYRHLCLHTLPFLILTTTLWSNNISHIFQIEKLKYREIKEPAHSFTVSKRCGWHRIRQANPWACPFNTCPFNTTWLANRIRFILPQTSCTLIEECYYNFSLNCLIHCVSKWIFEFPVWFIWVVFCLPFSICSPKWECGILTFSCLIAWQMVSHQKEFTLKYTHKWD